MIKFSTVAHALISVQLKCTLLKESVRIVLILALTVRTHTHVQLA